MVDLVPSLLHPWYHLIPMNLVPNSCSSTHPVFCWPGPSFLKRTIQLKISSYLQKSMKLMMENIKYTVFNWVYIRKDLQVIRFCFSMIHNCLESSFRNVLILAESQPWNLKFHCFRWQPANEIRRATFKLVYFSLCCCTGTETNIWHWKYFLYPLKLRWQFYAVSVL